MSDPFTPHPPGPPHESPTHRADQPGVSDAYLWDKTGAPDPAVARLESLLAPHRLSHAAPDAPPAPDSSRPPQSPAWHPRRDRGGTRAPRPHRRRSRAWILPALGVFSLFAVMAIIAWPMRPWSIDTHDQHRADDPNSSAALPLSDWTITPLAGAPSVGGAPLAAQQPVAVNEWVHTNAASSAELSLSSMGRITVSPNSSVRVKPAQGKQQWLELTQGRIEATIHAPPRLFFVQTPAALAVDMGCAYTLDIDPKGKGTLHVTAGWVELQRDNKAVRVPRGSRCIIRPGTGPGTPVSDAAADTFAAAVDVYDSFAHHPTAAPNFSALDAVLAEADRGKLPSAAAITLWHILRDVPEPDRLRVIEKLASLVPPPAGVTTQRLRDLDPDALDQWWSDIRFR
ncbi:MAG: FecR domain-containing protein [Phycisphaerales bacterium]